MSLDANGVIRTFNPAAVSILALESDVAVGATFAQAFVPLERLDEFNEVVLASVYGEQETRRAPRSGGDSGAHARPLADDLAPHRGRTRRGRRVLGRVRDRGAPGEGAGARETDRAPEQGSPERLPDGGDAKPRPRKRASQGADHPHGDDRGARCAVHRGRAARAWSQCRSVQGAGRRTGADRDAADPHGEERADRVHHFGPGDRCATRRGPHPQPTRGHARRGARRGGTSGERGRPAARTRHFRSPRRETQRRRRVPQVSRTGARLRALGRERGGRPCAARGDEGAARIRQRTQPGRADDIPLRGGLIARTKKNQHRA